MSRFVEGLDRSQVTLIPECLDDFITQDNAPVISSSRHDTGGTVPQGAARASGLHRVGGARSSSASVRS